MASFTRSFRAKRDNMNQQEKFKEALEHMEHVVAQRAKNRPNDILDIRLVGPSLSITLLEIAMTFERC